MLLVLVILFFVGAFFGSFLNVCIDRLPRKESIVKGSSHCDSCKKKLAWYDLIPLFSYLQLGGKCRHCHAVIGYQTLFLEVLTGILFASVGFFVLPGVTNYEVRIADVINLLYYLLVVCGLIVIFFIDLKHGIIPDKIIFSLILLSLIYVFLMHNSVFLIHLLSALGAFGFFLFIFLITKMKGMGFGDVKFALFMGLFLGMPGIISGLYVAFLTGGVVSFILILWGKKKFHGGSIPFGPFLVFGTLIGLYFGDSLAHFFLANLL